MHSSVLLLVLATIAAASNINVNKRQTSRPFPSTTTSTKEPEGTPDPIDIQLQYICAPTEALWKYGTYNEKKLAGLLHYSWSEIALSFKDSPFPCEKLSWYLSKYTDFDIGRTSMGEPSDVGEVRNSTEDIKHEREYLCSPESGAKGKGKYFELRRACLSCDAVHAYGEDSEYIKFMRAYAEWVEHRFCNETVPEWNLYKLINSNGGEWKVALGLEDRREPDSDATLVEEIATKTEVSLYYTATVNGKEAEEKGSMTTAGSETTLETSGSKAETSASVIEEASSSTNADAVEFTATSPAAAASSSVTGGVEGWRAPGKLAMAVFGAMVIL